MVKANGNHGGCCHGNGPPTDVIMSACLGVMNKAIISWWNQTINIEFITFHLHVILPLDSHTGASLLYTNFTHLHWIRWCLAITYLEVSHCFFYNHKYKDWPYISVAVFAILWVVMLKSSIRPCHMLLYVVSSWMPGENHISKILQCWSHSCWECT